MRHPSGFAALLLFPLLLLGCQRASQPSVPAHANKSGDYVRQDWRLPSSPGAAQPALVTTDDGRVLLSWIDSVPGRRNALQFAAWGSDDQWQSAPRTIAVGDALLADWANTPHMSATSDGALWVDWLQKAGGGEASDLMLSRSVDGGFNWSPPARVNVAADHAEHGFAALWPASRSSLGVAWLDGPVMAMDMAADADASGDQPGDATALNAAVFDANLARSPQAHVDLMACDCCQTDAAMTTRGALLVYRDRSAQDIRDIATTRFDSGKWSDPRPVHVDNWKMTACPVNGPSIAAERNNAVVAWYTAAGDKPTVKLARSADAGDHFAAPLVLDSGADVEGRVSVALDAQQAWVLWVREDAGGQSLWLARYAPDLSRQLQRMQVAKLQGRGRATGFPQLVLRGGNAYAVWTDVIDGAPQLRGAVFTR